MKGILDIFREIISYNELKVIKNTIYIAKHVASLMKKFYTERHSVLFTKYAKENMT